MIIGVILLMGRILKSTKVVAVDATGRARATFTHVPVGPVGGSEDVPVRGTKPSLLARIGRGLKKAAERIAEAIVELCELTADFAAAKKAKFCPLVHFVD